MYPIEIDIKNMSAEKVVKLSKQKANYENIKTISVDVFESQFGC